MTSEQTITVTVGNLEEAGSVSFSKVGAEIRAELSDPDGGVSSASWQWARSSNGQGMGEHRRRHLGQLHAIQRRRGKVLASQGVL